MKNNSLRLSEFLVLKKEDLLHSSSITNKAVILVPNGMPPWNRHTHYFKGVI